MKMETLRKCFYEASQLGKKYIGVKIEMQGFEKPEVIINESANFDLKFDYYRKTYLDDLVLKSFNGIKIIAFAYGDSFAEIEEKLFVGEE